jgi:hypothetical protein
MSVVSDEVGQYDFVIVQGATFNPTIIYQDSSGAVVDITNWTARMKAKTSVGSTTAVLDMSTENGQIVITGAEGKVQLLLEAKETQLLDFTKLVYDLELIDDSAEPVVKRLLEGKVELSKEVTKNVYVETIIEAVSMNEVVAETVI